MTVLFWVGFVVLIPGLLVLLMHKKPVSVAFTTLIASTLGAFGCLFGLYKLHHPSDISIYAIGVSAACFWLIGFRHRHDRALALTAMLGLPGITMALRR